jgi:hypothetical protein
MCHLAVTDALAAGATTGELRYLELAVLRQGGKAPPPAPPTSDALEALARRTSRVDKDHDAATAATRGGLDRASIGGARGRWAFRGRGLPADRGRRWQCLRETTPWSSSRRAGVTSIVGDSHRTRSRASPPRMTRPRPRNHLSAAGPSDDGVHRPGLSLASEPVREVGAPRSSVSWARARIRDTPSVLHPKVCTDPQA